VHRPKWTGCPQGLRGGDSGLLLWQKVPWQQLHFRQDESGSSERPGCGAPDCKPLVLERPDRCPAHSAIGHPGFPPVGPRDGPNVGVARLKVNFPRTHTDAESSRDASDWSYLHTRDAGPFISGSSTTWTRLRFRAELADGDPALFRPHAWEASYRGLTHVLTGDNLRVTHCCEMGQPERSGGIHEASPKRWTVCTAAFHRVVEPPRAGHHYPGTPVGRSRDRSGRYATSDPSRSRIHAGRGHR
jgi:hypothetical protein